MCDFNKLCAKFSGLALKSLRGSRLQEQKQTKPPEPHTNQSAARLHREPTAPQPGPPPPALLLGVWGVPGAGSQGGLPGPGASAAPANVLETQMPGPRPH